MAKIFSYGTLWQPDTQLSQFGMTFSVDPDLDYVDGWDIIKIRMRGGLFSVAVEGESTVGGAIVDVPDELLPEVDKYEGREYKRIKITTLTGNECQMYVKR
jgi:gamma-glutamylcyclotransferase (GGCT)/AIG2-like uncharacterized protein YtfP